MFLMFLIALDQLWLQITKKQAKKTTASAGVSCFCSQGPVQDSQTTAQFTNAPFKWTPCTVTSTAPGICCPCNADGTVFQRLCCEYPSRVFFYLTFKTLYQNFVWQKLNFSDSIQIPLLLTATLSCVIQTDRQTTPSRFLSPLAKRHESQSSGKLSLQCADQGW